MSLRKWLAVVWSTGRWSDGGTRPPRREAGATVSEYALLISLVLTVSVGAITLLESESGSYLVDSGSAIGEPRGLATDYGLDDPVTPPWLTQPPPPTTTTTTPPTTTTTTPSTTTTTTPSTTTTTTPLGSTISPRHSGLCLAVQGASTAFGASVVQETCSGATSQQWTIIDLGGGYSSLQAVHSAQCLDVEAGSTSAGATLIQWTCDGGMNQQVAISPHPVGGSWLTLRHSGLCIDVPASSTVSGVQLIQWSCTTNPNQAYDIT